MSMREKMIFLWAPEVRKYPHKNREALKIKDEFGSKVAIVPDIDAIA